MRKFERYPKYTDYSEVPAELKTSTYSPIRGLVTELAGKVNSLGAKTGWWQEFKSHRTLNEKLWENNRLVQERLYSNGHLYNVIYFRSKGVASVEVSYTGAPIRSITTDTQNVMHGTYQEWDVDGNIFLEAEFRKGVLHGVTKIYWPSGSIQSSCKFVKGNKFGHERSFYEDGKLKTSVEYRKGLRKGWCYYWDPEGLHIASFLWIGNYYEDSRGSRDGVTKFNAEIAKSLFESLLGHFRLGKHRDAQKTFRPQNKISSFYERLEVAKSNMRPLDEVPACV